MVYYNVSICNGQHWNELNIHIYVYSLLKFKIQSYLEKIVPSIHKFILLGSHNDGYFGLDKNHRLYYYKSL